MSKRKILLLAMSIIMVAILAVGGTLAYFNDTDSETNVFTFGDIDITLEEVFPEDELMPGENNALQKRVSVYNEGPNEAYMWVELWVPAELSDGVTAESNDLHLVFYNTWVDDEGNVYDVSDDEAAEKGYELLSAPIFVELEDKEYDGVTYKGYRVYDIDSEPKAEGESTGALLSEVYMDKDIKLCTDSEHEENCLVLKDATHYTGSWEIIVNAYGMQAQGFANIEEAIDAYDGEVL